MVSMFIIYMIPIIVNLLTCGIFDSNQPKTNFICCHQGGCSTAVLPYFVRPQVKATLNAPNGGIPNFIPTGWCEFKCRATLLCDNVTQKQTSHTVERESKDKSLSVERSQEASVITSQLLAWQTRNKDKCHRIANNSSSRHLSSSSSRTCKS